ncbi:hypothetical protein BKA66DRAFT_410594 [Pyrenochaeta sp. MPI-SDFR-AT-0127]|nr:hypothetical protein BKA66DRAFT_410594 [Pyrenochaeta sp. MPI-SDFR-AT-0127]
MPSRKRNRIVAKRREDEERARSGLEVPKEVRRVDSANLRKDTQEDEKFGNKLSIGDKRKKSTTPEEANKAPKTKEPEEIELKASPVQVLKFLLSDAALQVCRPEDEVEDVQERGKDVVTYSQLLSPFEELLCAVVLSRPISHRLGLRTIRTVLSPPYAFRNPVAIKTAGSKKVLQALQDARTQHKDKTAEEIELIADAVSNNNWHNDLGKIRKQTKGAVESERELLRRSIKGLGKTGLDIFYRRIQWLWTEAYPFVDSRTHVALEKLGLPKRPEGIVRMIEVRWDELNFQDDEEYNDEEKRRRAFVILLERAVGADLEKKIDAVLGEASKL